MADLRRAGPDDAHAVAPLILEAAPHLRLLLGGDHEAWHAAEDAFRSERTMFGYRWGMIAEEEGAVRGFVIAFPGRKWGSLKLGTGVVLARAAGVKHAADLVKRGRVLDRLHPPVPEWALYVSALAVHPQRRRAGIARTLMQRVIAGAAHLRLAVALDVDLDNEAAWDLYEGMGFSQAAARETGEAERALVRTPGFARLVRPSPPVGGGDLEARAQG
jgi:ribosomal protein S18 acetylase RimI-like enzyme